MSFTLTVGEVARTLNISKQRVYQLINNESLAAEKIGNMWLIDSQSVNRRIAVAPKAGRPSQLNKNTLCNKYTLMNGSYEVLDFCYDARTQAFVEATDIWDASRAPLGLISPRGKHVSKDALSYWWQHRCIPKTRNGISAKLTELGIDATYQIPFESFGLSLSDQYWIRPQSMNITWENINFFDNPFEGVGTSADWLSEVGLQSPDNTSEGELPKCWICDGDTRILLKGGSVLGQEPYNEVIASKLYQCLLEPDDYIEYQLINRSQDTVCSCKTFVNSREEYIPAYYVRQIKRKANHHSDYQHYLECCAYLGVDKAEQALAKMIVCDDIMGNFDRHWRNFGLIRNIDTLEYRIAPLFDTGNSLWCNVPEKILSTGDFSFTTKPFYEEANRQLRLVNDYTWFNPDALQGFAQDAAAILRQNSALVSRADLIEQGIQYRIDRITRML